MDDDIVTASLSVLAAAIDATVFATCRIHSLAILWILLQLFLKHWL